MPQDDVSRNCDEQEKIYASDKRTALQHTTMSVALRFGIQLSEGRDIPCRIICHFRFEFFVVAKGKKAFKPNEKRSDEYGLK